tara:strand:+ start:299 stop:727 length:429 start_codon:yes stop_codon:yes gene_type:complete
MKLLNNLTYSIIYFIVFLLVSRPVISSQSKREFEFTQYTFRRPPFSLSGTIDSKANYYYFTNARPIECDLRIGNACYMKTKQKATIISPEIIQVGNAYACAESIITKQRKKTEHLPQFSYGYGTCTKEGWVSKENHLPSDYE